MIVDSNSPAVAQSASESASSLEALQTTVADYPLYVETIEDLREMIETPIHGMHAPCAMLIGAPGAGKTAIIQAVLSRYRRFDEGNTTRIPALLVNVPVNASIKSLAEVTLTEMGAPFRNTATQPQLTMQIEHHARECGTKVIIFDEFHHVASSTSALAKHLANWIKQLINTRLFTVVVSGTSDVDKIFRNNSELLRRCERRFELKPFRLDREEDVRTFRGILKVLDRALPFANRSDLDSAVLSTALLVASLGNLGRLNRILVGAVKVALPARAQRLEIAHLSKGWERLVDHIQDEKNPFKDVHTPPKSTHGETDEVSSVKGKLSIREAKKLKQMAE